MITMDHGITGSQMNCNIKQENKQDGADGKISIWDWAIEFVWNMLHLIHYI